MKKNELTMITFPRAASTLSDANGPAHVILKMDKWDYFRDQIKKVFFITFLASDKVLSALGNAHFFLHSFSS